MHMFTEKKVEKCNPNLKESINCIKYQLFSKSLHHIVQHHMLILFFVTFFVLFVNTSSLQCRGTEQRDALFTKTVEFALRACMTANLSLDAINLGLLQQFHIFTKSI